MPLIQDIEILILWNFCRGGTAVSSEMSGGSHREFLSSHSTSEDEDTKSEKVRLWRYPSEFSTSEWFCIVHRKGVVVLW